MGGWRYERDPALLICIALDNIRMVREAHHICLDRCDQLTKPPADLHCKCVQKEMLANHQHRPFTPNHTHTVVL